MKTVLCISLVIIYLAAVVVAEQYTSKFENIDLDAILNNDRLLNNYADCIIEVGNCTPEGTELKSHIREALETGCSKCSPKHEEGVRKVFTFLAKNKPDIMKKLLDKYDPDAVYRKKYADLLEKEGIQL